ncbi:MAG: prepilin-type N-terminal cleavage/methylation domain-containing protein [Synergistaceae bacterium]|nr:prepilin-type N-terminal cleavage/methylation domain-containing protein [Synergistaceae bacterium]
MKNVNILRKGFTLVELLIVIVVIGVLAAMMMLSSTEAVSSAKAIKIVSDLTNLKKALMEWYVDNLDYMTFNSNYDFISTAMVYPGGHTYYAHKCIQNIADCDTCRQAILKYLNNEDIDFRKDFTSGFRFMRGDDNRLADKDSKKSQWFVGFALPNDASLKQKLAGRAASSGLLKNPNEIYDAKGKAGQVLMMVFDFKK